MADSLHRPSASGHNPAPSQSASPADRLAVWLGLLPAALVTALLAYPGGAHPLQNGLLCAAWWVMALVLSVRCLSDGDARRSWLAALTQWPMLGALGLAAFAALRLMLGSEPHFAGRPWVIDLQWLAVALALGASLPLACRAMGLDAERSLRALLAGLAAAGVAYGLLALYQRFVGYDRMLAEYEAQLSGPVRDLQTQSMLHALREQRAGGRLGNPNLFAAQLSIMGLCGLCLPALTRSRALRAMGLAAWALTLAGVVVSGSRGGLLTFVCATLLGGVLLLRSWRADRPRPVILMLGAIALLACAAPGSAWAAAGDAGVTLLERIGRIDTIRERLFYWHVAWRLFIEDPIMGAGPGSFLLHYAQLKPELARESQYAHSWLFQTLAELGLMGLLFSMTFWLGLARRTWDALRARMDEPATPAMVAALGACVLGFNGLFEFSLQWREFLMLTGLLAGMAMASTDAPAGTRTRRIRGGLGAALLAIAFILSAALSPAQHRAQAARWLGLDAMQAAAELAGDEQASELRTAGEAFARAAALQPDNPAHVLALAQVHTAQGRDSEALYRRAAELHPTSAGIRAEFAGWLWQAGRRPEAFALIDAAVSLYPSHVGHRLQRAAWRLELGDLAGARADLQDIRQRELPIWEFEAPRLAELERRAGLPPFPPTPTPQEAP